MRPQLRLFTGDDNGAGTIAEPLVSVRFGDITHILEDAVQNRRAWISDFEDDEIQITPDLYEVLSAYWHLRPSA